MTHATQEQMDLAAKAGLSIQTAPVWPATIGNLLSHSRQQKRYAKEARGDRWMGRSACQHADSARWAQRCLVALRLARSVP